MSKKRKQRKTTKKTKSTAKPKATEKETTKKVTGFQTSGKYVSRTILPDVPIELLKGVQKQPYYRDMRAIFDVQSTSRQEGYMLEFLREYLNEFVPEATSYIDEKGNLYVTKGTAQTYPCVVSHIDTVHAIIPRDAYRVYQYKDKFWAVDLRDCSRTGIGGDDKCGIFLCLQALKEYDVMKCAFFVEEEIGCVGSYAGDLTFFEDVSFALQGDRRGYHDFVNNIYTTTMYGKEFSAMLEPILDKFKREEADGGLTDVKALAQQKVNVCMANASCGYYRPHSSGEYVKGDELILTWFMFKDIIDTAYQDGERWVFVRADKPRHTTYGSGLSTPTTNNRVYGTGSGYWAWLEKKGWVWKSYPKKGDDDLIELPEAPRSYERQCPTCKTRMAYDEQMALFWCYDCNNYSE